MNSKTEAALERLRATLETNARTLEEIEAYDKRVEALREAMRREARALRARRDAPREYWKPHAD